MTIDTKGLSGLTVEELKELKSRWYKGALEDGSLNRCYLVCTVLGERLNDNYGPKYIYHNGGLELYVDDWGNYFTATWKGKQVLSTHPSTHLFIPGQWMEIGLRSRYLWVRILLGVPRQSGDRNVSLGRA